MNFSVCGYEHESQGILLLISLLWKKAYIDNFLENTILLLEKIDALLPRASCIIFLDTKIQNDGIRKVD